MSWSGNDLRSVASSVAPSDRFGPVSDLKSSSATVSSLVSFEPETLSLVERTESSCTSLSLVERTESACTLTSTSDYGSMLQPHADGFIRVASGLYLHGCSADLQEQGFVKEDPNTLHEFKLLGLSLTVDASGDWVVAHVAQTRAAAAGSSQAVHPGEICVLVDEWDIKGASQEQVRELLEGPVGSNVLLTVKSKSGQTRHVEMTRGKKLRKQQSNSLYSHTATRTMKHEDVGLHEAYAADSYGQSSNLRNNYASDAEEEPAAAKTGVVSGARSDAHKPRELHTSLELKGTLQHAANLYHTSRVSPTDPPQSAGEGGGGGGGGVVEEPLVQVKKQKARAEPGSDRRSDPFTPTPSSGSCRSPSPALPAPTAAMSISGLSHASSVAPSKRFARAESLASERFGPVSSSGTVASFFGASRTNSAAPNRLQPETAFGMLHRTESARDDHNSAPARVETQLSRMASEAGIRALELKARIKEQESQELTKRVSRLQAELQEREELEKKAARKYLQQQAILDQHRHREEQLLRRRHDQSGERHRTAVDEAESTAEELRQTVQGLESRLFDLQQELSQVHKAKRQEQQGVDSATLTEKNSSSEVEVRPPDHRPFSKVLSSESI